MKIYNMYFMDSEFGIVSNEEIANEVQVVSIPKGKKSIGFLLFKGENYSIHCKNYAEYLEWLKNRNEDRFKMNKDHGKNYDSKNCMHMMRILNMSKEIANGEINVRRSPEEIKILMQIRKGEMEYDDIIEQGEAKIKELDKLYDESNLPDFVDKKMVNDLLIKIRKLRYNLQ